MSMNTFMSAALMAVLAVASSASAQAPAPNLEKLKQFKVSGTDLNIPTVPQTGRSADGSGREVFARGVRNSVGMDFNPKNGELWFTDNQVDGMGDDQPPGELNRAVKPAAHYGFPWYGGGKVRTAEYKDSKPPADALFPELELAPHAADLGMTFYTGTKFPQKYQNGIFIAEHGSWNRTTPIGARVMFVPLKANGSADRAEVFAEGWLDPETKQYRGRPVDVAVMRDGSMLVSDDFAGALYRITYVGE